MRYKVNRRVIASFDLRCAERYRYVIQFAECRSLRSFRVYVWWGGVVLMHGSKRAPCDQSIDRRRDTAAE